MDYLSYYHSPLGILCLRSDGECLTGLSFDNQRHAPAAAECYEDGAALHVIQDTRRWLDAYFAGDIPTFTPRLKVTGTPFRRMIADIMLRIPYGKTMSYGQIAKTVAVRMGRTAMSAQAVGGAVGHNPIAIIIPCHRVLGADGSMTGYAAGLERKDYLLRLEGIKPPATDITNDRHTEATPHP